MSSRPARPDTREINSQAGLGVRRPSLELPGLVSDFLTIPAGSPFSTLRALKPTGRKSAYAWPGTSWRNRTARLTGTAHLPSDVIRVRIIDGDSRNFPPRDHRHAGHQNASLKPPWECRACPHRCLHLHRRPTRSRRETRSADVYDYADSGSYTEGTYRANEEDFARISCASASPSTSRTARSRARWSDSRSDANRARADRAHRHAARRRRDPGGPGRRQGRGAVHALDDEHLFDEDVAENTDQPFWFQLYVMRDRDFINRLIDRAKKLQGAPHSS